MIVAVFLSFGFHFQAFSHFYSFKHKQKWTINEQVCDGKTWRNWRDPSCLYLHFQRGGGGGGAVGQCCRCATDRVSGCVSACLLPGLFVSWIRLCFWARPHAALWCWPPYSLTDGPGLAGCLVSVACACTHSHPHRPAASHCYCEQSIRRQLNPPVL